MSPMDRSRTKRARHATGARAYLARKQLIDNAAERPKVGARETRMGEGSDAVFIGQKAKYAAIDRASAAPSVWLYLELTFCRPPCA
jgi:hypothetical protein